MKVCILADDLSGAADCALGFRRAGRRVDVLLHAAPRDEDIVALDTDSRPLPASVAAERAVAAYRAMHTPGSKLYKKIDSTLRGPWAAEVAALQPLAGVAIVAPAFPSMGRTVRHGQVYVNGQPLQDTATWRLESRGNPAGLPAQLVAAGLQHACIDATSLHALPNLAANMEAVIVDAQSEEDLQALARATLQLAVPFFWVGSAGLANAIAGVHPGESAAVATPCATGGPILAAVGSVSAVSDRQCAALLARCNMAEITVPPTVLRLGSGHSDWGMTSARIGQAIASGTDLLLRVGRDDPPDMREAPQLSVALARLVAPHFGRIGALMATGGETARAILERAGVDRLRLLEEVEPGVPLSIALASASSHQPCVVTKAGAFGSEQALYHGWQRLTALRNQPHTA